MCAYSFPASPAASTAPLATASGAANQRSAKARQDVRPFLVSTAHRPRERRDPQERVVEGALAGAVLEGAVEAPASRDYT